MDGAGHFSVIAIPLSRKEAVDFLLPPSPLAKGTKLQIVGQRPTQQAREQWLRQLRRTPTIERLLAIHDPHEHLVTTTTDRLVPIEFLREPEFLTRNLGGWAPIYFGVVQLPDDPNLDPLLDQQRILDHHGARIQYFGADEQLVASRLNYETGLDLSGVVEAYTRLDAIRNLILHRNGQDHWQESATYVKRLYTAIANESNLREYSGAMIPRVVLLDELLHYLVGIEDRRRQALADNDQRTAEAITAWQTSMQEQTGLRLILKGEYIVGRHRRSTVLIAPQLGLVIKQPAPEPFHEIELNAGEYRGQPENWPVLTEDGSLVTATGRIRIIIEDDLIPNLNAVFNQNVSFISLLGLSIEPFIEGPTIQSYVRDDHQRMAPPLYEQIVLHQQVCEQLGVENGDWHSANFIVRDDELIHIDWGAARPINAEEKSLVGYDSRLQQVRNLAFSFHDDALAKKVEDLHQSLLNDQDRLDQLRRRAEQLVGEATAA